MKPEPSLPALFLQTIKKLPPSQRVFTLPVETLVRDFMNREENHGENL